MDKVPGHEVTWECPGDNWLYPGGDSLNDEIGFRRQFRIKPIEEQSFLIGTCRAGELLSEGVKQMKVIANFISERYQTVLPKKFEKRRLAFRSTYTNRCLASLQALMHYMFPGAEPIEVFVANEELETLVPNGYVCPALGSVMKDIVTTNGTVFRELLDKYNEMIGSVKNENNVTAVPHFMRMAEMLVTHHCESRVFPPGFDDSTMNASVEIIVAFFNEVFAKNRRFASGILLSEIYIGMRDYLSGGTDASSVFISGHTLTLMSIMGATGMDLTWPQPGAMISFELLENDDGAHVVRALVNGHTTMSMPLAEFRDKAMSLRPTEEECKMQYPFTERDKKDFGVKMLQMSFS